MAKFPAGANPVAPLPKNQDDPSTLKRAVDKRSKRVPVQRVTSVKAASKRAATGGRAFGR